MSKHTIPEPGHRVFVAHDSSLTGDEATAQTAAQTDTIVGVARQLAGRKRYVAVEVFYQCTDRPELSTSEGDFAAVLVDTKDGVILEELPPYDEIDPEWRSER